MDCDGKHNKSQKRKSNKLIKRITNDDDQLYLDDIDIASALNTQFCTVGKKTAAKLEVLKQTLPAT